MVTLEISKKPFIFGPDILPGGRMDNIKTLGKKLNFDVMFGPSACLLCQKHHPKRMPSFDVYAGKPVGKVRPVIQSWRK